MQPVWETVCPPQKQSLGAVPHESQSLVLASDRPGIARSRSQTASDAKVENCALYLFPKVQHHGVRRIFNRLAAEHDTELCESRKPKRT
jgi:hypothetical protein